MERGFEREFGGVGRQFERTVNSAFCLILVPLP